MTMPAENPNTFSSEDRELLKREWEEADSRYRDVTLTDLASAMRWKELHDRERELRLYNLTKKATFRGVLSAHLLLGLLGGLAWFAFLAVVGSGY